MRDHQHRTLLLLTLFLLLMAGAVYALFGNAAGAEVPVTDEAPAVSSNEMIETLRSLLREVQHLRIAIGDGTAQQRASFVPASMRTEEQPPEVPSEVAPTPSAAPVVVKTVTPEARGETLSHLRSQTPDDRSHDHFFWSYQQVLNRYGVPDTMYHSPDGLLTWVYCDPRVRDQLSFSFHDGFVINVDLQAAYAEEPGSD